MFTGSNIWFAIRWILVTVFGYTLGLVLYFIILFPFCDFGWCAGDSEYYAAVIAGVMIGTFISYFQYLVIRKRLNEDSNWFRVSAPGWITTLALYYLLETYFNAWENEDIIKGVWRNPYILLPLGIIGVLLISRHQWKKIIHQLYPNSTLWIYMSIIGMLLGLTVRTRFFGNFLLIDGIIVGSIYSLCTSLTLIYFSRNV